MTSRIIVNNIQSDTGISSVTFGSPVSAPTFIGNVSATTGITTVTQLNVGVGGTIITTTANGSVGIGTINPSSILDVRQSQVGNPNISLTNSSTASGSYASYYLNVGAVTGQFYCDAQGNDGLQGLTIRTTTNHGLRLGTNNTERLKIDSSGRVTMPFQPTFCGISTYGSAFAGTSLVPMIFGGGANTYLNQGNHYNTSTGVFTCPVAANYQVHVQGHVQDQTGYTSIRIRKNSSTVSNAWQANSGANQGHGGSLVCGGIFACAANDTLDIEFLTSRSANYIAESYWLLSITLIG